VIEGFTDRIRDSAGSAPVTSYAAMTPVVSVQPSYMFHIRMPRFSPSMRCASQPSSASLANATPRTSASMAVTSLVGITSSSALKYEGRDIQMRHLPLFDQIGQLPWSSHLLVSGNNHRRPDPQRHQKLTNR
jgi:hypothetical protein